MDRRSFLTAALAAAGMSETTFGRSEDNSPLVQAGNTVVTTYFGLVLLDTPEQGTTGGGGLRTNARFRAFLLEKGGHKLRFSARIDDLESMPNLTIAEEFNDIEGNRVASWDVTNFRFNWSGSTGANASYSDAAQIPNPTNWSSLQYLLPLQKLSLGGETNGSSALRSYVDINTGVVKCLEPSQAKGKTQTWALRWQGKTIDQRYLTDRFAHELTLNSPLELNAVRASNPPHVWKFKPGLRRVAFASLSASSAKDLAHITHFYDSLKGVKQRPEYNPPAFSVGTSYCPPGKRP
jgi:hypothetical protein